MKGLTRFALTALVIVMLFNLIGCSAAKTESETGSRSKAAEPSKEKVTISYFISQSNYKDFQTEIVEKFMEKYPHITVDTQVIPDDQFETNLKVKFSAGEGPDVVAVMSGKNMRNYNYDNFLAMDDTEPWVSRLMNPEAAKHNGKVMGFSPSKDSGIGILYNKKIFEENNISVPKTYDEFMDACETIKNKGITPLYYSDGETWTLQIWLTSLAPIAVREQENFWQEINTNKRKFADSPELVDILAKQYAMVEKGYVNDDHISATYDMGISAMAEEKAAMYLMGAWAIPEIQTGNPDADFGMFAIPFLDPNPDIISAGNVTEIEDPEYGTPDIYYAISAKTKYPEEAKLFLAFQAEPENVALFCETQEKFSNFKDVDVKLSEFQQSYYDNYIATDREMAEMNGRLLVDLGELWAFEQDMLAGGMTPKEVLEAWDKKYEELCQAKGVPGF